MDVFKRPQTYKTITSTAFAAFLLAAAVFTGLLISSATKLSSPTSAGTIHGPLALYEIQKTPAASGSYQASITILPSFALYLIAILGTGTLVAILRIRATQRRLSEMPR